jgi:hypothetical protein
LTKVDRDWKIRNRRQRTEIGKYSFANKVIQLWNKLPMNVRVLQIILPAILARNMSAS